jgi:hypothetical protein
MDSKKLVTPRAVWFGILSATVIFLVLPVSQSDPASGATLFLPMTLAAVGCGIASVLLPMHLQKSGLKRLKLVTVEVEDRERAFGSLVPKRRAFKDPDLAELAALRVYQTSLILGLALAESIALDGFVLKFLAAGTNSVIPFFVASWLLILVRFPRRSAVIGPLERAYGIGPVG